MSCSIFNKLFLKSYIQDKVTASGKLIYKSNIRNVYLTYLRGLEIAELKEEDMPMV